MGKVAHFLGTWKYREDDYISVYLNQEKFAENIIDPSGLSQVNIVSIPYRYGHIIDSVFNTTNNPTL